MIGDIRENQARFSENRRNYELLAATLISCWTILEDNRFSADDWAIFNDRKDGIAIVSDVESVSNLMADLAKGFLTPQVENKASDDDGRYAWNFFHGRVIYYGTLHPPEFETMDVWKWKRQEYQHQREYRFAFLASSPMKVDSVVFHVQDPGRYIQEIHFGPEISTADKRKLLAGAIAADLAGKIQHFETHFSRADKPC